MKVREGTRERLQAYEGVCIGRSGKGLNESFTVRKISFGEGVERVFPIYSPLVDSIEVVRRGKSAARSFITCAVVAGNLPGSPKRSTKTAARANPTPNDAYGLSNPNPTPMRSSVLGRACC